LPQRAINISYCKVGCGSERLFPLCLKKVGISIEIPVSAQLESGKTIKWKGRR
jgi:hypothetical protein